MGAFFVSVWEGILNFIRNYNWLTDTLDILIVAFVIYGLIRLIRDSRAEQLIKGFFLLGIAYGVAYLFGLTTIKYFLQIIFDNALILLVIIFQPELRRVLEQVGHTGFERIKILGLSDEETENFIKQWKATIASVCTAVGNLQREKMGALIVFERNTRLGEIAESGTLINADATSELIGNVFFNKAPLHDGAMILRDAKIAAAGCILPLTEDTSISRRLGTRHRAGVGMSENSDAVVVIVSEETGTISVAKGGELTRDFTLESLRIELENEIVWRNVRTDSDKKESFVMSWLRKWRSK